MVIRPVKSIIMSLPTLYAFLLTTVISFASSCCLVTALNLPTTAFKPRYHYQHHRLPNKYSTTACRCQIDEKDNSLAPGLLWPTMPSSASLPLTEGINDNLQSGDGADMDEDDDNEDGLSLVLDSILKVHATHSEPDYLMPWQRTHQTTSSSSGFVIEIPNVGLRIMTNAHSVEYGSIIQVQRRGEETKYQAKINAIANECDLAILSVDDENFWEDLSPLEFGPLPTLQDEVEVLGYPTGGDSLSVTCGVVSRIEMQEYVQAGTHLLAIQIDAAINAGNSGGPVVNEDLEVVGVAFQALDNAENIGFVVPVTVVQHVLEDIRRNNGLYTGFCSLGVQLSLLENIAFRKSLKMVERHQSGVMVREIAPTSPVSKGSLLTPKDVIMAVDGISIGNDGKIPFRRGERVALICYIQTKFVGDFVNLTLLRDGKEMKDVSVPVGILQRLVPAHWNNRPPPYVVCGGLVFTALSVPYLEAVHAWESYVSGRISHLVGIEANAPLEHESDEVVVLSQVLAHPENLGYEKYSDLHLTTFNGEAVRSLSHLKKLIDDCQTLQEGEGKDEFIRLEFAPSGIIIMECSNLQNVTDEICKEHFIQKPFILHDESR